MSQDNFDEFAVGWEAQVEDGWAPVYSVQDYETANALAHQLREIHAANPLVRNVGLFGRPAKPAWVGLELGPAPAPVVEDQAVEDQSLDVEA